MKTNAQNEPDFQWGNVSYFNLNVNETLIYQNKEIKLLQLKNHFNQIKIGEDTTWLKVGRRTLPIVAEGIRIIVADNANVKRLSNDSEVHGLLKKDVLIGLSDYLHPMLDPRKYAFPVSFNDGFIWKVEGNSHMFSYEGKKNKKYLSHPGINFDLHDARGILKHWIVAVEESRVVWVKDKFSDKTRQDACVLLESKAQPGIYYVYNYLYRKNVIVDKGDDVVRSGLIATAWGADNWGHLHFSVIKSDTVPEYNEKFFNAINCFAPVYELYFSQNYNFIRNYSKGKISFGMPSQFNGDEKNLLAFENYSGKGWKLGNWNTADKVEWVASRYNSNSNARLKKKLFASEKAFCVNPDNYYDYEINVRNGVYRIRARVGDVEHKSWQKIQFEGVNAATYELNPGEYKWTPEKVVRVKDAKLTVRIYVDENNKSVAGISEIVFQRAQ